MVRVLIDEIKNNAKKNHVPIMQDEGIEYIVNYIKQNNVKTILEIGTAVGYSSIMFASISEEIHITTIERDDEMYKQAVKNINKCCLNHQIEVIHDDALKTDINGKYDLIFIDAAKSQYIKFFEKYKHNLDKDGVIITDNLSFHGLVEDDSKTNNRNTKQLVKKIRNYIEFLKNNEEFDTEFLSIGDGISISKLKISTCKK